MICKKCNEDYSEDYFIFGKGRACKYCLYQSQNQRKKAIMRIQKYPSTVFAILREIDYAYHQKPYNSTIMICAVKDAVKLYKKLCSDKQPEQEAQTDDIDCNSGKSDKE